MVRVNRAVLRLHFRHMAARAGKAHLAVDAGLEELIVRMNAPDDRGLRDRVDQFSERLPIREIFSVIQKRFLLSKREAILPGGLPHGRGANLPGLILPLLLYRIPRVVALRADKALLLRRAGLFKGGFTGFGQHLIEERVRDLELHAFRVVAVDASDGMGSHVGEVREVIRLQLTLTLFPDYLRSDRAVADIAAGRGRLILFAVGDARIRNRRHINPGVVVASQAEKTGTGIAARPSAQNREERIFRDVILRFRIVFRRDPALILKRKKLFKIGTVIRLRDDILRLDRRLTEHGGREYADGC